MDAETLLKSLIFLPLDLPPLEIDPTRIDAVVESLSLRDDYRNCAMVPLHTPFGKLPPGSGENIPPPGLGNKPGNLQWSEESKSFPEIYEYHANHLGWLTPLGRTVFICTKPFEENPIHIDCSPKKFHTVQLKFRCVVRGNTSTVWYWDGKKKHHVPEIGNQPFIMSGEFPHGMTNDIDGYKYTFAIGSPWECQPTTAFMDLVNRSIKKYNNNVMWRRDIDLPDDYERYFQKEYAQPLSK